MYNEKQRLLIQAQTKYEPVLYEEWKKFQKLSADIWLKRFLKFRKIGFTPTPLTQKVLTRCMSCHAGYWEGAEHKCIKKLRKKKKHANSTMA